MEHLLVMPVSAGLLAESHLSSDRKMLGACTTSSHIVHDARHRSCLELLRNVSVEIIPTKNGIRTSLGANMAYHEQYMQCHRILGDRNVTTTCGSLARVSAGRHENLRRTPIIMLQRNCQTTPRAVTSGDKPRTTTGLERGTGVAIQA
uniref:Uncharacterized protein n=1 Tax=Hyaloperonospora arabidopsidis (strain Emoy2) TaxID=559515 RepID=M4BW84_HYAAE